MVQTKGLTGLRPSTELASRITSPPYDVIKVGTRLQELLQANENSLYHITLGPDPLGSLDRLIKAGSLQKDDSPCYYVYEQQYGGQKRVGVLAAVAVSDYSKGEIIRHEKTFDDKVKGRLELTNKTGYTFEPVFLLTKSPLNNILTEITGNYTPVYEFVSEFEGTTELHGIKNIVFRVGEAAPAGQKIKAAIAANALYIADGHHRYHAALLNKQTHCLAYICEAEAVSIQAYNRVINGRLKFEEVMPKLALQPLSEFKTPPKNTFAIYTKGGSYLLTPSHIPDDVVGRLDCSILEKELYPHLGLTHDLITDQRYFDYYAEYELDKMVSAVEEGTYDLAVALHPVSVAELLAVADRGIDFPGVVMPEKSTFFAPKILSGLFIYHHELRI
jgi:uncharacterized protein (DUF1015 family)